MENFFKHYAASESLYTLIISPVCEKHQLTHMEFTVLMFLANNPQFDTARDIIKYRHLTKSHVSMTLRSLENKGFVKGEFHNSNRRTIHLTVLETAKKIVADGKKAQQSFGNLLFSNFSDSEYEQLIAFIKRIDENINCGIKSVQKTGVNSNGNK